MIRFSDDSYVPGLKRLWVECFPEDTEYCEFYFDRCYRSNDCIILENDGALESAIYFFRGSIKKCGREYKALFLYAGATGEKFRRRGNIRSMIEFLKGYCAKAGIHMLSLSSEESALAVERCGFIPDVKLCRTDMVCSGESGYIPVCKCGYGEFAKMRNEFLEDGSLVWEDRFLKYMFDDIKTSGDIVCANLGGVAVYAVYTLFDGLLLIRETNCPPEYIKKFADAVCGYAGYTGNTAVYSKNGFRLPELEEHDIYYAHTMFFDSAAEAALSGTNIYINLTAE